MTILVGILNLGKGKIFMSILDFGTYVASCLWESPISCLISTPYVYQNLEFSWTRSNMYKKNVTFACDYSRGDSEFGEREHFHDNSAFW